MSPTRATGGDQRAGALVARALLAVIDDCRLRVRGVGDDRTPLVAYGATVIGLEEAARREGVDPTTVPIDELRT